MKLMTTLLSLTVSSLTVLAASTPAGAQTRTASVSAIEAGCRVRGRTLGYGAEYCARVAEAARSRYGDQVTVMQWNSAAAVTGHKVRQGK
jgi:hypothetical protein